MKVSAWPPLQILIVKKGLKLCLKLCLKLRVQNCEEVPVNNFQAAEQGLAFFGRVSGRFSNFSLHFSNPFSFHCSKLFGRFILQRCHPKKVRVERDTVSVLQASIYKTQIKWASAEATNLSQERIAFTSSYRFHFIVLIVTKPSSGQHPLFGNPKPRALFQSLGHPEPPRPHLWNQTLHV